MKRAIYCLLLIAGLIPTAPALFSQDAYRTDFTAKAAQWTNAANWQRFDVSLNKWVAADHFPGYADGVITIQSGDSVLISGTESAALSIDQVVVEKGAVLVIGNNQKGGVALLNGAGDDLVVNGRVYLEEGSTLHGPGRIQVNKGGFFALRNSGILKAALNNDGLLYIGERGIIAGILSGIPVVNNDTCIWVAGNILLDSVASFVNNGVLRISSSQRDMVWSGNNNGAAGIVNKGMITNTGTDNTVDFRVVIDNRGTIGGVGTVLFTGGVNSAGVVSPGSSPGHLTVGPGILKSPVINIEIATTGGQAGVNYDQLTVSSLQDLAGATINITDAASDSVNTEYTIINALTRNARLPYPDVILNVPSNFSSFFRGAELVLKKTAGLALPVSWGGFKAVANGNSIQLTWVARVDDHTTCFVIEHSTNAVDYKPVGRVDAKEVDAALAQHSYTFTGADVFTTNYFRIKKVNDNGRSGYSPARCVRFDKGAVVLFQAETDLENDELQFNIQSADVTVSLNEPGGKLLQQFIFQPGQHAVYIDSLPAGAYHLNVFVKDMLVEMKQIVKR